MSTLNNASIAITTNRNPDYELQYDDWVMMDDLSKGSRKVKEKGAEYLPMTELESREVNSSIGASTKRKTRYQERLSRAVFINGIDRLTKFAMGHLFRESVKIPKKFSDSHPELMENADLLGTDLKQFMKNVSSRAYTLGHQFVCVDMPKVAPSSLQEQKDMGWRPYLISIDPRDVVDWSISNDANGIPTLDWVILLRTEFEERLPFKAAKPRNVYMVWYRDRWERYREDDKFNPIIQESGENPLGEVPLYGIYSNLQRPMVSSPPLLEAAFINLNHFQTYSAFTNGLMYHLNPLLAITGVSEDADVRLTASSAVYLPREADAKYVEFQGSGLKIAYDTSKSLSEEMMEAGLRSTSFLGANTSAEARRVAKSDFNSFLISVANSYEHGWMRVFRAVNKWMSMDSENEADYRPTFNKDFDVTIMDAGLARFYLESLQAGAICQETFLKSMVRGEVFAKELDVPKEIIKSAKDAERFVPAKARGGASNLSPPANPTLATGPEVLPKGQ